MRVDRTIRGNSLPWSKRGAAGIALLCATVVAFATSPQAAAPSAGKTWSAEALIKLRTITDTRISPDGSEVLYVVSQADLPSSAYKSAIFSLRSAGGVPVPIAPDATSQESPRWSPDGTRIAYLQSSKDGPPQIWVVTRHGTDQRQLTDLKTGVQSLEWSPDGTQIAFLAVDKASEEQKPVVRIVDAQFDLPHLHLVDARTEAVRTLTKGSFMVENFDWSPDGKTIALSVRGSPRTLDDYQTGIDVVDVTTGAITELVKPPGRNITPQWSHDGSRIAFMSTMGETGEYASAHVMIIPAAGGALRNVSPGIGERVYDFYGWSPDDRTLYFRVRQGVTMQVIAADARTGETHPLTKGPRVYDSVSFSRGSKPMMSFVATDPTTPKDLYVSKVGDFRPQKIVTSNPEVSSYQTPETRLVHWTGRDGLRLEGLLTLPVGYVEGQRYPLLVELHGGPSGGFSNGFVPQIAVIGAPLTLDPYPTQIFAAHGYAVFMPNIRGGGGYGEQFRKADIGQEGGEDLHDVLTGVDALEHDGIADKNRLGVMGWSYGGFMSAYIITQTDRFKAASVGAGVSDTVSEYGTTDQPDQDEAYNGGPPWKNVRQYEERSAVLFAPNIKTPTLIQQGDLDEAVPAGQADELYRSLVRCGVPVEYARYPRSGHSPTEPEQNMDVWSRNLAWFDRWLK